MRNPIILFLKGLNHLSALALLRPRSQYLLSLGSQLMVSRDKDTGGTEDSEEEISSKKLKPVIYSSACSLVTSQLLGRGYLAGQGRSHRLLLPSKAPQVPHLPRENSFKAFTST